MKKWDQISTAIFLAKYGGLALYDEYVEKIYTIDHEDIHFFNKKGWSLVGIPDEPDGSSTDHKFFSINKYLFDRVLATHQNNGISLNMIVKYISLIINKDIQNKQSNKNKKTNNIMEPGHNFEIKRHKPVVDYNKHSLDNFQLIVVSPSPYLISNKKEVLSTSYLRSYQYQIVEIISKQILTHLLNRWDESKTNSHLSYIYMTLSEHIFINFFLN